MEMGRSKEHPIAASVGFDPGIVTSWSPSHRGLPSVSRNLFRDRLGLQELQQIIRAAGLRVRAGHVEAPKRMRSHHRPGTLAVDVQIANEEPVSSLPDLLRVLRE